MRYRPFAAHQLLLKASRAALVDAAGGCWGRPSVETRDDGALPVCSPVCAHGSGRLAVSPP